MGRRKRCIARRRAWSGRRHVRLRVGVIGLGRLWETRHKPSLARLADRFRVTAVYDQVFRRAEIEAAQIGCTACEGLSALIERPDVDVIYLLVASVVRAAPDRGWLARPASRFTAHCRWPTSWPSWKTWPGWSSEAGSSSCRSSPGGAIRRRFGSRSCWRLELGPPRLVVGHTPPLRLRPLRDARPDNPDCAGTAVDRSRELLARLVLLRLPVDARSRCKGFDARCSRSPDAGEPGFGLRELRRPLRPRRDGPHLVRPVYQRARWGDASRFLPTPGFQVFAERGAAWLEMPERIQWSELERNQRRAPASWSRQSATCSTTSSTGWSGAIIRWRRQSARRSRSPD